MLQRMRCKECDTKRFEASIGAQTITPKGCERETLNIFQIWIGLSLIILIMLIMIIQLSLEQNQRIRWTWIHESGYKSCSKCQKQSYQIISVLNKQQLHFRWYLKTLWWFSLLPFRMTLCDYCGAPKFGQGIRVIKPAAELFGVRYIPILFYVCSQYCRRTLRSSGDVPSTPEL